jgi:hypothetical protein
LAIMPHSEHDRRLIIPHPPLCHCSRRGAGLRSPVRTCQTPPATVPPTPCTFPLRRTLRGHGRRPPNAVRLFTGARLGRRHPDARLYTPLQPTPHHQLALQDTNTSWVQSGNSQGRLPRPPSCSAALSDKEDQLCSPGPGGEEMTCRYPTRVTRTSLVYKRRRSMHGHGRTNRARAGSRPLHLSILELASIKP